MSVKPTLSRSHESYGVSAPGNEHELRTDSLQCAANRFRQVREKFGQKGKFREIGKKGRKGKGKWWWRCGPVAVGGRGGERGEW